MGLLEEVRELFGDSAFSKSGCIIWDWIVRDNKIPEDFILRYSSYFYCSDLIRYQKITLKIIKEYYNEINNLNLWDFLLNSQILSEDIILEFIEDFGKKALISLVTNQKLSVASIERLKDVIIFSCDKHVFYDKLVRFQFLDEDFIATNISKLNYSSVLLYQRITPSLISKIEDSHPGFINLFKDYFKSGIYSKTDIGKDWFITFVYLVNIPFLSYSRCDKVYKEISADTIGYYDDSVPIYKARVWYKDIIVRGVFKRVDIICECSKDSSSYKRW